MKFTKKEVYERLARERDERVDFYNKGIRDDRWEGSNPSDRDRHGREVGFINALDWVMDTLFPEMKQVKNETK